MSMLNTRTCAIGASLVAAALGSIAPDASADVNINWSSETQWIFDVTNVTDLDQKRWNLPNNGLAYCVPASTLNWTTYLANHGRPSLLPGPGDWESQEMYELGTIAMATLGIAMGTNSESGTSHEGMREGFHIWTVAEPIVVVKAISNDYWSPIYPDAARAVFQGGYVILGVGWYLEFSEGHILRDGGHAVSLASGARSDLSMVVGIRDPGSDENLWGVQSPFTTEEYDVIHRVMKPYNYGANWRYMSRLVGYGNAIHKGFLDSYTIIVPGFVVTSDPESPAIAVQRAFVEQGSAVPGLVEHPELVAERIIDLDILQDLSGYVCVVESLTPGAPNELWRVDAYTGAAERIDNAALTNPQHVVVGRYRDLYLMDETSLVQVNLDVDPPLTSSVAPPGSIGCLEYDDETDEVLLVATDTCRLLRYAHDLSLPPEELPIAPEVPMTGRLSLCTDDARGDMLLVSDTSNLLWKLTEAPGPAGPVIAADSYAPAGIVAPKAIDVDDHGRVYVSTQEQVVELEYSPDLDEWTPAAAPLYGNLVAGDCLVVARSRVNDDPNIHYTPAWRDVPPGLCAADITGPMALVPDGIVDALDYLLMLSQWGSPCVGSCEADITGPTPLVPDGNVDALDFLLLVGQWGTPGNCP